MVHNNQQPNFDASLQSILIDHLPDFVIVVDAQRNIVFWNHVASTTFGYTTQQVVGAPFIKLLNTEAFDEQKLEEFSNHLTMAKYWEGEIPFSGSNNGRGMWYFVRVNYIEHPALGGAGMAFVGTKLHEHEIRHHRVQTALDYSQRELSNILSAVGDLVCAYNHTEQSFDFISPSCYQLTGYTEFELMDNPKLFFEMISDEHRGTVEEAFASAVVGTEVRLEYPVQRKDGEERWIANTLTPYEDDGNKRIICALTDTTAYRELSELKSRMIRMATHDLNNPLSTAVGFFSLLAGDLADMMSEEQHMMVENIHRSHDRMAQMLEELLDFEEIDSRQKLNLQDVDFIELVETVLGEFTYQIQAQQHDLKFTSNTDAVVVQADIVQFKHAIANYISNAIKYTPDGGKISIVLTRHDDHVTFEVTDNGIGIPENVRDKLFQTFFRAKQPGTDHIPGTGLGLSLVKSVLRQHKGDVYYEPQPQGSKFGFWLPV